MKKALAAVMVMLVAVPAFARPLCEMGCQVEQAAVASCCCGAPLAAGEDLALTAPPCCPTPSALTDAGDDLDGIPAGRAELLPDRPVPFALAGLLNVGAVAAVDGPAPAVATTETRPPAAVFLRTVTLLL